MEEGTPRRIEGRTLECSVVVEGEQRHQSTGVRKTPQKDFGCTTKMAPSATAFQCYSLGQAAELD